ncbi:MAG: Ig-like domain-containing protein [Gemmatimonadaceae bacterium]|nr:Ig-like domain-containing protein [Gemmatimonadaceae bacterium]
MHPCLTSPPPRPRPTWRDLLPLATLLLSLSGCGGGAGGNATVPPPPSVDVASVELSSGSHTLNVGERVTITAVARTTGGAVVTTRPVSWSTSAPTVAQVGSDGTVTAVGRGTASITATVQGRSATVLITVDAPYDLEASGVPRIVTRSYIDLARIERVSRFRSAAGHDYSDVAEQCRSMKHYFQPYHGTDWGAVTISAPLDGTITAITVERSFGMQLRIESHVVPAVSVVLFHVTLDSGVVVGREVAAGQRLGLHVGNVTSSDVALQVATVAGLRLVSYFDAMTDEAFAAYQARGIASRSALVIGASERDANPLRCEAGGFLDTGTISNWVDLQ